uniref:SH3 domain-containing YSC84-like protein 1 n=1 Tax=Ornithorhynchus anatinus TaxID=9258 RepID=F7F813_ORNAN
MERMGPRVFFFRKSPDWRFPRPSGLLWLAPQLSGWFESERLKSWRTLEFLLEAQETVCWPPRSQAGQPLIKSQWSAPSAIGIAGLGGGFEIGIEVSDLVIILNYDRAVEAFAKGGNLTLGGNCTVAVGPLGRNLEGDVALRSSAAVYTYCKSRGLFAGVSLEGSCLIERKETNRKFYCQDIRASDILFGNIPRPAQAEDLYEILESFTEKYDNEWQRINARKAAREQRKAKDLAVKPVTRAQSHRPSASRQQKSGSQNNRNARKLYPELPLDCDNRSSSRPKEATALYSFEGQHPGDLSFQAGDKITVLSKTASHFDWWEGRLRGQTGIFPANYITMN